MGSGRNSKSIKLLWLSLLPPRMMKIHPKLNALECSQHFSHYKSMGFSRRSRAANSADPGPILLNRLTPGSIKLQQYQVSTEFH